MINTLQVEVKYSKGVWGKLRVSSPLGQVVTVGVGKLRVSPQWW